MSLKAEQYIPYLKDNKAWVTNYPITINANLTVNGTITSSGTGMEGAQVITATSANALAVGQAGTTNPALNVNTNTASSVTGINLTSNVAASGFAIATTSSGTNENLTIDAKGSGTVTINGTATGIVALPAGSTVGGTAITTGTALTNPITATSATAFGVGQNGATNPAFNIDTSTSSSATGINIKSAAAAGGVALSVLSSGTNEALTINSKGTGQLSLNSTATGLIVLGTNSQVNGTVTVNKNSATALVAGQNGATNPALTINTATTSSATGVSITSAAAATGIAIGTTSSGTNENLTISAKGSGTVTFNPATTATAGGAAGDGIQFGSLSVGVFTGTGAPTFSAMNGSIYVNSAATTTTTRIYVNNSGSGTAGTTWTNLTTAA